MFFMSKTVFVSPAKKMMSLVSGRGNADSAASSSSSSSSLSLRAKMNKRKLYRPEISSPMDMPSHPVSVAIHKLIMPHAVITVHTHVNPTVQLRIERNNFLVKPTCQQNMEDCQHWSDSFSDQLVADLNQNV